MRRPVAGYGAGLLLLGSLLGLGKALFNYFWPGNGIHGTPGALLVVLGIALMVLAVLALALVPAMPRWLRALLLVLVLLDIFGSGFAAYFLEAWWVIGAMALALLGFLIHLTTDWTPQPLTADATSS